MILFIGPHVKATGTNDGVSARVMSIDSLFDKKDRTYLHISFSKYLRMEKIKDTYCTIFNCNYFIHCIFIAYFIFKAKHIYIHTMMNFLRSLPLVLLKRNVFVDIHGVLVDELKYNNAPKWKIKLYERIEKMIIKKSFRIICVTEEMKKYYIEKFNVDDRKFIVLPILDHKINFNLIKSKRYDKKHVIYAGNLDKWQNIDKMLDISSRHSEYEYQFLVSDKDGLEKQMKSFDFTNIKIKYDSVPKNKVPQFYKSASFGFVIRDNNILNKVSCPTKLVEYICNGIIPIMNDFQLGDFKDLKYISVQDFENNNIPDEELLKEMAYNNALIYSEIYKKSKQTTVSLQNLVVGD